jgi:hypothetical protein
MKVVGIDPGLSGGLASWDGSILDWWDVVEMWAIHYWDADKVFIEQVSSRPGQGVASTFKFGVVYGGMIGIAYSHTEEVYTVTPRTWKKHYGLDASKEDAVKLAAELFPSHANTFYGPRGGLKDGIAEAALIAKYGYDLEMTNDT